MVAVSADACSLMFAAALCTTLRRVCRTSAGTARGSPVTSSLASGTYWEAACSRASGSGEASRPGEASSWTRLRVSDRFRAQQLTGLPEILPGRRLRPGVVCGFEQEQAAGQALGHGVVDLPGAPLALRDGARAALAGGQLPLGESHFVMQAPLLGGVVLNAVVDQRQQDADGERAQEHGEIAGVAEPEQPRGGGCRRRPRRRIGDRPGEGDAAQERTAQTNTRRNWARRPPARPRRPRVRTSTRPRGAGAGRAPR
jgi:hypothetical protein